MILSYANFQVRIIYNVEMSVSARHIMKIISALNLFVRAYEYLGQSSQDGIQFSLSSPIDFLSYI